jgi:SAM-dependent methyltransferase|tara:strand:- start:7152 stop:7889 length:738 start_codon:yes stop_codon:yes gene_type:complete
MQKQADEIKQFYQTAVGRHAADAVEKIVWQQCASIFGYYALELGDVFAEGGLLKNSTITKTLMLKVAEPADVIAEADALPFENDSIDLIVLPHSLDVAADPHQVLREVERCLVPGGYVIIIGFNLFSLYGLRHLLHKWRKRDSMWSRPFYSSGRIRDWCSLLGLDQIKVSYAAHLPPIQRLQQLLSMQRFAALVERRLRYSGGVYVMVAHKRIARLTPLRRRWVDPQNLIPGKIAKPSIGMRKHD